MKEDIEHRTDNDSLFANYKDVDSFISVIKEFNAIDLNGKKPKEIETIYFNYFPLIPSIWFGQRIERFNKHTFYRLRKNIDKHEESVDLVSTYSYPSSKLCSKNGRANLKGKSVFYCSDNAITTLMECELVPGDIGYLSIWKPKAEREIRFQYCLPRFLRPDNNWNEVRKDIHPLINGYINNNYKVKKEHITVLINYLFQKFVSEVSPYPLTSWLADNFLYRENWIDLILYPSVAGGQKDCNMAISPNTVDNNLRFQKVIKFEVMDVKETTIAYKPISVGALKHQLIEWRSAVENEKDFAKFD